MAEKFDQFRDVVRDSVTKAKGALVSSYADHYVFPYGGAYSCGDVTLLGPGSIKIDTEKSLDAYTNFSTGSMGAGDGWAPYVNSALLSWKPRAVDYAVVFKINTTAAVVAFEGIIEQYDNLPFVYRAPVELYFMPMFQEQIVKSLDEGSVEMVYPTDKKAVSRALRSWGFSQISQCLIRTFPKRIEDDD